LFPIKYISLATSSPAMASHSHQVSRPNMERGSFDSMEKPSCTLSCNPVSRSSHYSDGRCQSCLVRSPLDPTHYCWWKNPNVGCVNVSPTHDEELRFVNKLQIHSCPRLRPPGKWEFIPVGAGGPHRRASGGMPPGGGSGGAKSSVKQTSLMTLDFVGKNCQL